MGQHPPRSSRTHDPPQGVENLSKVGGYVGGHPHALVSSTEPQRPILRRKRHSDKAFVSACANATALSTKVHNTLYGAVLDAAYLYNKHGAPLDYDLWQNLQEVLDWLSENWQRPDEGMWEVRGGKRHFVSSKLMCWVALERAVRVAHQRGLPAGEGRWISERDAIYKEIMRKGWNSHRESFVQHYGSDAFDASLLLMPLVKFVGPTDPRWLATMERIQAELTHDVLVNRYDIEEAAPDGLEGKEGTFSLCSFWLGECLTQAGRLEEARLALEKMFSYANHLGLYAEEIGRSGEALGNFPQAFTHLALISATVHLNRALGHG